MAVWAMWQVWSGPPVALPFYGLPALSHCSCSRLNRRPRAANDCPSGAASQAGRRRGALWALLVEPQRRPGGPAASKVLDVGPPWPPILSQQRVRRVLRHRGRPRGYATSKGWPSRDNGNE